MNSPGARPTFAAAFAAVGAFAAAFAALVAALAALPTSAAACPVCFGDADSGAARGLEAAIVLMFGATGLVGAGIAAFVLRLRRLSKRNDG